MKHVGIEVKHFNNLIERNVVNLKTISMLNEISSSNGYILRFLEENENKVITQKDIEKRFCITRSTASTVLSLMEKKSLITRTVLESDNRIKLLKITDKGKEVNLNIQNEIDAFEKRMIRGLSEEELHTFFSCVEKMKENIKED